jgi:uncharacterized protein YndB with AHSA1/START domain
MIIKVAIVVNDSIERVWECWTQSDHIKEWYHATENWYVPAAEIDFREGGKFTIKMASFDKTGAFSFNGAYTKITKHEQINFTIEDGRKVVVKFEAADTGILITEQFEATTTQPPAAQDMGWQMLLRSFKAYVESGD